MVRAGVGSKNQPEVPVKTFSFYTDSSSVCVLSHLRGYFILYIGYIIMIMITKECFRYYPKKYKSYNFVFKKAERFIKHFVNIDENLALEPHTGLEACLFLTL